MSSELPALWEQALDEQEADSLADAIVALARSWAGDDPGRLAEAARILAETPYLNGEKQ